MPGIVLIEGPVGAGKSTIGLFLSQRLHVPCLVPDDWMANLLQPDHPEINATDQHGAAQPRPLIEVRSVLPVS